MLKEILTRKGVPSGEIADSIREARAALAGAEAQLGELRRTAADAVLDSPDAAKEARARAQDVLAKGFEVEAQRRGIERLERALRDAVDRELTAEQKAAESTLAAARKEQRALRNELADLAAAAAQARISLCAEAAGDAAGIAAGVFGSLLGTGHAGAHGFADIRRIAGDRADPLSEPARRFLAALGDTRELGRAACTAAEAERRLVAMRGGNPLIAADTADQRVARLLAEPAGAES